MGTYPNELKAGYRGEICTLVFVVALSTVAQSRKQQGPVDGRTDKRDAVYTYDGMLFSLKRKEILTQATVWMNLEDIILSDMSQSQKDKNFTPPLLRGSQSEFKGGRPNAAARGRGTAVGAGV